MEKTHPVEIEIALKRLSYYVSKTGMPYLNCRQAAKIIGKSHTWVWNKINEGYIPAAEKTANGGKKLYKTIKVDDLEKFLEEFVHVHRKPLEARFEEIN